MIKKRNETTKKTTILLCVIIFLFSVVSPMQVFCAKTNLKSIAEDLNKTVVEELDEIDFSKLNLVVAEFEDKETNLFSLSNLKQKVYEIVTGESAVSYENMFAFLFSNLIELIVKYVPLLSIIVAIGVVSNLLNNVKSKFNEKSTSGLIHTVCFLSVSILIIAIINNLVKTTTGSLEKMVAQINAVFPILLTLMVGLGANASVGVFQPIVAIMSTYTTSFFKLLILPLFTLNFVFGLISNLSDNVKLDKFSSFISSLFKWSVGLVFTLFFAVMTVQGISAGHFDSVGIRTTKYTIKSYVPIMGSYLSDGMDLIMASTVLIKNAVGLVGILLIVNTILSPILEIAVCSLLLKLVSAVLQPMGNNKISNFLSSTSKSITMLSTCVIAVGFMYFLSIGLVMTTSNVVM